MAQASAEAPWTIMGFAAADDHGSQSMTTMPPCRTKGRRSCWCHWRLLSLGAGLRGILISHAGLSAAMKAHSGAVRLFGRPEEPRAARPSQCCLEMGAVGNHGGPRWQALMIANLDLILQSRVSASVSTDSGGPLLPCLEPMDFDELYNADAHQGLGRSGNLFWKADKEGLSIGIGPGTGVSSLTRLGRPADLRRCTQATF